MTGQAPNSELRLGVLLSGSGSTLANLIGRLQAGNPAGAAIAVVVSSRRDVQGVTIARDAGLPVEVIRPQDFLTPSQFSEAITASLDANKVGLALLAGYLCHWRIPPHWRGRALNIHPALLPKFGGRGMYGYHVHAAVLAAGERESGCTVHLVDEEYDHGPRVAQARVPVLAGDTPEALAARVQGAERTLYPWVLTQIVHSGLGWLDRFTAGAPPVTPDLSGWKPPSPAGPTGTGE